MIDKDSNIDSQLLKIVVIENTKEVVYSKDIIPQHYNAIIINFKANINIRIENTDYTLSSENLIFVPKDLNFCILKSSIHKIYIATFSSQIFDDNSFQYLVKTYQIITNQKHILCFVHVSEKKFLKKFFRLIQNVEFSNNNHLQKEFFLVGFNYLKQKIFDNIFTQNIFKDKNFNVFFLFIQLLELHFIKEHSVKFYADKLNITPNYLNKIVKEYANIPAKKYIESYLIIESKLLLHNPSISISEISEILNFSNVSAFSNFFKKQTCFTPSYFRLIFGNRM